MKDLGKIVSGLTNSGALTGFASGAAGGAVTSMLMGKKSKKMGKKALKLGALAAVGGLAWKAYQSYSQDKNAKATPQQGGQYNYLPANMSENRFDAVLEDDTSDCGQMLLVRAMIAAAYADGHIDAQEQQRIFQQVEQMDLSTADKAALFDELRAPRSIEQLLPDIPNSETAVEVYAASLLAIDQRQPASETYLQQLGDRLFIPTELRQQLHFQAASAG